MGKAYPLIALFTLLWASSIFGHPSHNSFAELDWSESGKQLEVSLRVVPEDLETALAQRVGRSIVLQNDKQTQSLVQVYLQNKFQIRNDLGELKALSVLGLAISYDETWIHFTVIADRQEQLTLSNRVLQDVEPAQVNRVQRLWLSPDKTLVFNLGSTGQPL
ncbi:MAG: hypothetical protein HOC23_09955 [Halieaceae bacterium]|jgi:hypothetical protein|nr:hypothetical protein [Halieaceae bacterium]